jgi:hypothetical protein
LSERTLGPLRQGQRLDTTKIKCSKIADSSRWGKRARHHRQKSTTKKSGEKELPNAWMQAPPWTNAFSPNFLSSMQTPPGIMNWVLFSPLLIMHELSLQVQACASQYTKSTTTC